jgi:hypothetical protein
MHFVKSMRRKDKKGQKPSASSADPFDSPNPDQCESSTASSLDPFDEYEGTVDDCPTARCADSACARFEAHFDKTDEFGIGGDFVPKVNDMSECALLLLTRSPSSFDDADLTAAS